MATISSLLKIISLFCKRALQKRRYSAKANFKEPNTRRHPIVALPSVLCRDALQQPALTHCNNTLQQPAILCSTLLQTHCNTVHHTARCTTLQHRDKWLGGLTHCNTLRHTATHYNSLQFTATHCPNYNTPQHRDKWLGGFGATIGGLSSNIGEGSVCCNVLQCAAVCCSVLQCVALCCSITNIHESPHRKSCHTNECLLYDMHQRCMHSSSSRVAVCCSALHCVPMCCSVLHVTHQR